MLFGSTQSSFPDLAFPRCAKQERARLLRHDLEAFPVLNSLSLNQGTAYMASITRDEFADAVENAISRQGGELATNPAKAHGAQIKSQQQAEQSKDSPIDLSREGSAKPARRKRTTKATKRTPQAAQTSAQTYKSTGEILTPAPQATHNRSVPATVGAEFVADLEPVPAHGGFLCTFTLSRPGLVGLNKLAIHLNDLQGSGSIGSWQTRGWEDPATKVRTLIGFATHADATIAIKSAH
jgi:hypothetical protein